MTQTTSLMPVGRQRYYNNDGTPCAGGLVWTYAAGTTAPKTTYADADGTTPNPNPVPLDAHGEAVIFWNGAYKVDLKQSDGQQVTGYPVDNLKSDPAGVWNVATSILMQLIAGAGAQLVGFVQAGVGAIVRTLLDKGREVTSPEDYGAIGDGVADDGPAWQKAINSFAQGASCSLRCTPGKTYLFKTPVTTNNRSIVIDGNNAIVQIGANMTYGLQIVGTNCELRNLQVNRAAGVVVTAGVYVSGLQHVLRNVTSRDQVWPVFIRCVDMKESHLTNLRVDNDVAGKTGIAVQFDYCVNNTVSNSMVGYCAQGFYGSSTPQPVNGYHNEGILFNNVIEVYTGRGINFDNGTFIAVSNCCIDFTEAIGIFVSNGTDLMVSNTWIASNQTNGFIGVGTLAGVDGVSLQNNTFVRGAAAITGTAALSLSGPNALVIGNRFKSGMNGGVVTQVTSQVIGNVVTGGGSAINAAATVAQIGGKLNVDLDIVVGGNEGIFPEGLSGGATAGGNGPLPATVAGYATFALGGTNYKLPYYNP